MHRTTRTSENDDPSFSRESPSRRRRHLAVAAAVAATLGLTAVLWTQTSHDQGGRASASAQTSAPAPDPLTSTSVTTPGATKAEDSTGKARDAATRTLADWRATNPAASGDHAVGGTDARGPGGSISEVLRIPALGKKWAQPVYEGVGDQQLRAGVGHFPGTEQPGQIGNFALAGHRSGVAAPAFRDIDRIATGSAIQVTTAHRVTYTYTVTRVRTVAPTDVNVLAQVPGQPNTLPTKAKLTLVTCWPADGHTKRVVVEADLVSSKGGA